MTKTGTKEWAEVNKNFLKGCEHGCKYCYAYNMAKRFKRVKDSEDWKKPELLNTKFKEKPVKCKGRIMFPTTHDILPEFIEQTVVYLRRWLEVGNDILIVSKPHFDCIKRLCNELEEFKDQIVFRFTIGSKHDFILKFWEPNAPTCDERISALVYAFNSGYKTSVSCEPYLDSDIVSLVEGVLPFVTDTVWIGKMNRINSRVDTTGWPKRDLDLLQDVKDAQTDEFIKEFLYEEFKNEPKVRWKDSVKSVLGLPEEEIG